MPCTAQHAQHTLLAAVRLTSDWTTNKTATCCKMRRSSLLHSKAACVLHRATNLGAHNSHDTVTVKSIRFSGRLTASGFCASSFSCAIVCWSVSDPCFVPVPYPEARSRLSLEFRLRSPTCSHRTVACPAWSAADAPSHAETMQICPITTSKHIVGSVTGENLRASNEQVPTRAGCEPRLCQQIGFTQGRTSMCHTQQPPKTQDEDIGSKPNGGKKN